MKSAIGYIRVSSEEQADSGLGLEAQRRVIEAFCRGKGLTLVRVHEDPGVSAGKPLISRPAGRELLAEARRSKPVVVVAKLDRLFRSVADAAQTLAAFGRKGIELVSIAESFDMTSPYGRAMAQMASVFAELERAMIRERTKAAMGVKRARGERISRHAPFGWDFDDGRLVSVAAEQAAIGVMKQLRADGRSFRDIASTLDSQGIKPKRGEAWAHNAVRAILARSSR